MHASPAWRGFLNKEEHDHFHGFFRCIIRERYLPEDSLSVDHLSLLADEQLLTVLLMVVDMSSVQCVLRTKHRRGSGYLRRLITPVFDRTLMLLDIRRIVST